MLSERAVQRQNFSRNLLFLAAGWMAMAMPSAFGQGDAAPPQPTTAAASLPAFGVVSVKPTHQPCQTSELIPTPDGLHIACLSLQIIIQQAYGINDDYRIIGVPAWAKSTAYDIEAKVDGSDVATYGKLTPGQRNFMIQPVLQDRFHLQVHRETKDMPVYDLVIAKNGSKLKESKPDETGANPAMMRRKGRGQIESRSSSLAFLLVLLSHEIGRPIVDKTGLTSTYDFTLSWTPDQGAEAMSAESPAPDSGPSIFTALQEQLGLKLEPAKAPFGILVIDHVEHPSEN